MRKNKLLSICLLLNISIFAQSLPNIDSYYYYKREKIKIPINEQKFTIYFDMNNISKNRIKESYEILKEVTLSKEQSDSIYCCEVSIKNTNYDSILTILHKKEEIIDIEPVIGNDETILVSRIFYVQLKDKRNFESMLTIANNTNTTFISEIPYCKNWYAFECNKSSVSNAIGVSNIFYESGLFSNIDPGFICEVVTNCVTDSNFISDQWGMQSINACSTWNITTGDTSIKVAVIDQGIDEHHNEFRYVNKIAAYDISRSSSLFTVYGNHGTHVGGIIFANHNKYRIAGVAPNTSMINICHSLSGLRELFVSDMAKGINFAWLHGADVINNSWGFKRSESLNLVNSSLLETAIEDAIVSGRNGKGCIVVFSSGNKIYRENYDTTLEVLYPAHCNENILVVGAINQLYQRAHFSKYGPELDIVAPGYGIYSSVFDNPNGERYGYYNGTSMAAPHVSGVAALVLSVNPDLTGQQVRDIIEQTARKVNDTIYSYQNDTLHSNGTWDYEMGYGLVDAYAAVLKAMDEKIDLYIRDDEYDDGTEPNVATYLWSGPDIWIEDSTGRKIERPAGEMNYKVCVRIHNRSGYTSIGTEKLYLNWAKAGINDFWYDSWTDTNLLSCGVPQGGVIGNPNGITIPSISGGDTIVMRVDWHTPSGYDYANCTGFSGDPWHFCLLARIHDMDTIAHEKERFASTYNMVKNHNNVAQLNVYFNKSENYRTVVRMGNPTDNTRSVNLGIDVQDNDQGERISDFADIEITFDDNIFTAVQREDVVGAVWIDSTDDVYTLRITDFDNFYLPLDLDEGIDGTILTSVHFYADIVPSDSVFTFDLILYEAEGDIAGGQHYECTRVMDRYFQAGITGDVSIVVEDTFTALYAVTIGEPADYVWYDDQGNVVGTDSVLLIPLPFQMTTYSLSITAHSDGYRAFGDTSVVLYVDSTIIIDPIEGGEFLTSISPNPANNQVAITYRLPKNETQAVLRILGSQGQRLYQQNISGNREAESRKIVNTYNFAPGQYKVMLISRRGRVLDSKTLIIE